LTANEIPALPPSVDNGRLGYIQRGKIFARLSTTRSKAPKNKAKKKFLVIDLGHRS
jgi:hypothetical protein